MKEARIPWESGRKVVSSGPGEGKYKMSLEHLVVPEGKEVLKKRGQLAKMTTCRPAGVPNGQRWDSVSSKVIKPDYNQGIKQISIE